MMPIICQKCDVSQKKEAQDKRSNCGSDVPENMAESSGRDMGKLISESAEGGEIEIIAMELPWSIVG